MVFFRKTPPPPDSIYADLDSIEHEAAPGTEDQYAMVDRKVKKNTKPKPTPPEALYQVLVLYQTVGYVLSGV